MQSSTGQYSTQAGDPAHPVQHSAITASSLGFFLRGLVMPLDRGSCFNSIGTSPGVLGNSALLDLAHAYTLVLAIASPTIEPSEYSTVSSRAPKTIRMLCGCLSKCRDVLRDFGASQIFKCGSNLLLC